MPLYGIWEDSEVLGSSAGPKCFEFFRKKMKVVIFWETMENEHPSTHEVKTMCILSRFLVLEDMKWTPKVSSHQQDRAHTPIATGGFISNLSTAKLQR